MEEPRTLCCNMDSIMHNMVAISYWHPLRGSRRRTEGAHRPGFQPPRPLSSVFCFTGAVLAKQQQPGRALRGAAPTFSPSLIRPCTAIPEVRRTNTCLRGLVRSRSHTGTNQSEDSKYGRIMRKTWAFALRIQLLGELSVSESIHGIFSKISGQAHWVEPLLTQRSSGNCSVKQSMSGDLKTTFYSWTTFQVWALDLCGLSRHPSSPLPNFKVKLLIPHVGSNINRLDMCHSCSSDRSSVQTFASTWPNSLKCRHLR